MQKKFIAQGAVYQSDHSKVKLRGKFLKSKRSDMPTLLFFPELLNQVENYEKFFSDPNHGILNYRNVWILNPRNTGDSDHHESFELQDVAEDVARFMDEKQLTIATVGGHGYGAKVACAFGTTYLDRTSGIMCVEGGPIDHSYHPAWNDVREYLKQANKIAKSTTNVNDVNRKLDKVILNKRWNKIFKDNLIETSNGVSWKCNMDLLALQANRPKPSFTNFGPQYGLFPGRAFVQFASESQQVYLATNTIPIMKFFPKLEGAFPNSFFNFIQTEDDENNHWLFDYPDKSVVSKLASRMTNWLAHYDGVHVLLNSRSEVGWYGVPERYTKINDQMPFATEYTPEHLHHNWKFTNAYKESKKARGAEFAGSGTYSKGLTNSKFW